MKLYVVQGNVYLESYGDYRNIFGVYDDKNLANSRVEEIKAELYSEQMKKTRECKCYQTIIESIDDIDVTIVEVELNTPINKPIGGYAE